MPCALDGFPQQIPNAACHPACRVLHAIEDSCCFIFNGAQESASNVLNALKNSGHLIPNPVEKPTGNVLHTANGSMFHFARNVTDVVSHSACSGEDPFAHVSCPS